MNNCTFLGKLTEPAQLYDEDGVAVVSFTLEIEEYRKNKSGQKTRSTQKLSFQAWHTAAITINEKLNTGDLILVECSARNSCDSDQATFDFYNPTCYFRVNRFKIFNKYSQNLED